MTIINAIILLLIIGRLMYFNKADMTHKLSVSILSYATIIAAGYVLIYSLAGIYEPPHPGEVFFDALFMIILYRAKGNLSATMRPA